MRILVAVDDSAHSERAVRFVARMRWPAGSRVIVVNVLAPVLTPPTGGGESGVPLLIEVTEQQRQQGVALTARAEKVLREAGVTAESRMPTGDPRDAILALKQISISFPKGVSQAEATKRASDFATAMKQARGCGAVDGVAQQMGAQVVANDQVRARDLPGPLQEALLNLAVGETSPPFGSIEDGVRVLMLCGRDDPQSADGPAPLQVRARI